MTDRLYYTDSYLTDFTARVIDTRPSGTATGVMLDRTAFYPEGGGQPSDLGSLGNLPVVGVVEEDGQVVHLVQGPPPEGEVRCQLDWSRRFDHMQQHSGQHVLSQAFSQLLGTQTVSFHMGADLSTIDLDTPTFTPEQLSQLEELANRVVFENRSILVHLLQPEDLARFDLRKATGRTEMIRVVEVEGFDTIPCGGTHCRLTGEIGLIKVTRLERRGGAARAEFLCGGRALRDYQQKNATVVGLATGLSLRTDEVRGAVDRLTRDLAEVRHHAEQQRNRLLDYRAADLSREAIRVGGASVVVALLPDLSQEELKHLAGRITAETGRAALLAGTGDRSSLVFARSDDLPFDAGALLRQVAGPLGGRGGGRPNLAQGGIPDPASARAAVDHALSELRRLLT